MVREQTANFARPDAVTVVENWLASGEKIDAIIANNDEMAIGAVLVLLFAVVALGSLAALATTPCPPAALLVAAADSGGTIYDPAGIDVAELLRIKAAGKSVTTYTKGTVLPAVEIFGLDCDILIPAATPDVIHDGNAGAIKARLILQGANIPATAAAEQILQQRGILAVPDFIANAGGVIMAAMEYAGKSEQEAFTAIAERIRKNTRQIMDKAAGDKMLPRAAAVTLARERVKRAMCYRDH